MTTNAVRDSRNRAKIARAKNIEHTCRDCGTRFLQHPLGRSAHDRAAAHTAVEHGKFLSQERECQGSECVGTPFRGSKERRG